MKHLLLFLALVATVAAQAWHYFTIHAYAPSVPYIHGKIINARGKSFIIGADTPITHCPRYIQTAGCPAGNATWVTYDMVELAVRPPLAMGQRGEAVLRTDADRYSPRSRAVSSSTSTPRAESPTRTPTRPTTPRAPTLAAGTPSRSTPTSTSRRPSSGGTRQMAQVGSGRAPCPAAPRCLNCRSSRPSRRGCLATLPSSACLFRGCSLRRQVVVMLRGRIYDGVSVDGTRGFLGFVRFMAVDCRCLLTKRGFRGPSWLPFCSCRVSWYVGV